MQFARRNLRASGSAFHMTRAAHVARHEANAVHDALLSHLCQAFVSLLLRRADDELRNVMMRYSRLPGKQLASKYPQTALNGVNVLKLFYRI